MVSKVHNISVKLLSNIRPHVMIFVHIWSKGRPDFVHISLKLPNFRQHFVEQSSWRHICCPDFVPGSPSPVRLCPSCLRRFGDLNKNTPLDFLSVYLVDVFDFCRFQGPPSPVRLCRSCLRRFGDLRKTNLDFWSMSLVDFAICYRFQPPPALCVCVAAACAASATSVKTRPGILLHVSCQLLSIFVDFRVPKLAQAHDALWAHMVPDEPTWPHVVSYGPLWSILDPESLTGLDLNGA